MNCSDGSLLLYAVTDGNDGLEEKVTEAISGGATVVQLRVKGMPEQAFAELALRLLKVTRAQAVPLIINDSLPVALASGADGLHIGQDDGNAAGIRRRLGPDRILGVSVQNVEQALRAEADGADYLGVGAVFPTATKDDAASVSIETLTAICAAVRLPVVAIGGISALNVRQLTGSGIAGIAVVSALFGGTGGIRGNDRIRQAAAELRKLAAEVCAK